MTGAGPHDRQPVAEAGTPLGDSHAVAILVHGRNAGPENILDLVPVLDRPGFTYLAPAAAGRTWYPYGFMAPTEQNEPWLSSALRRLATLLGDVLAAGIERRHVVLLGFSQGACLASEFAVRNAGRFGAVIAFSGGLIGPAGTTWTCPGDFERTPVFLGCSDVDAHIPASRVHESARVFERMGAAVATRIYPGMGHTVSPDEIREARRLLDAVLAGRP